MNFALNYLLYICFVEDVFTYWVMPTNQPEVNFVFKHFLTDESISRLYNGQLYNILLLIRNDRKA